MGLILKTFKHVGNDVDDVYVNLKNVVISNELEENEIEGDDGDVLITRQKVWKRIAIFLVYMSQDSYKAGIEPIASYKVEFDLNDFAEDGVINIEKLYEQLIVENFEGTEIIHV